jgi:nucleoid-associated protein YgaU
MKQKVVLIIIVIVALGVGLAAGIIITNLKNKPVIADLQSKMRESEEKSRNYDTLVTRLSSELQQANTELEKLKPAAPTAEPTATAPAANGQTAAAPADNSIPGSTTQYTIKSGDSLWTIAQKQLGNGDRFKDILKLNPKITAKSTLVVGSKLNIPAK